MKDEDLAGTMFSIAVVCAILGVIVPWIALWFRRWLGVLIAGALGAGGNCSLPD